ncbi:MAG: FCD domain-containing protein [Planctomycetaceae bacterium]
MKFPPEAALSKQFGVSRTVTREAMQTLRGLGVIDVSRGKRPRIKELGTDATIENIHLHLKLSPSPLLDQLEFRTPVECHIVELACEQRSAGHLAALRDALDERRDRKTPEASVGADLRFHRILASTTGNLLFEVMLSSIGELMRQAMNIDEHGATRVLMDQIHEEIFEAVAERDPVRARNAMRRHMDESRKILSEQIDE